MNNPITSSTIGNWLFIFLIALALLFVMETLKQLWINWGWSHPATSSIVVAGLAVATWWLFGLLIMLATPRSPTQGASPGPPQTIQQSATASGGSTINQAGHDIIINQGVPEAIVREILKEKLVSEHTELSNRYPAGYVILGIANGALIEEAKLTDVRIKADWNAFRVTIDQSNQEVTLHISELFYSAPTRQRIPLAVRHSVEVFPLFENTPVQSHYVPDMYYEVLDATKPIFLIGFK